MIFEVLVSIFATLVSYTIVALYLGRRHENFPPGPITWPIFGNLLQAGMEPYKGVMKMRKKYGDIIGIDLGTKRAIFINDYKVLRELYNLSSTSGRSEFCHFAEEGTGTLRGMLFTSGQTWQEQRRFIFSYIQSTLRDGNNKEKLVMNEIEELIEEIKKNCGKPMDTTHTFNISAINSLWMVIAGKRYSSSDKDFSKMIHHATTLSSSLLVQGFIVFYPQFSKMFPTLSGYHTFRKHFMPILEFMTNIVKEHKKTYVEGIQRDFVDCYLQKIKNTTDPQSSFYGETGERHLEHNLCQLFGAGTETVSTTLRWYTFLMAHFPEKQKKLVTVLRKHQLENQRSISLQDRERLPYVEAVLQEVMRYSAHIPLGIFHEAIEDFNFHGYRIPEGTMIVANHYGIMHDHEVWGDPENFRPERFLTEDGNDLIRHPGLVPFGVGRRSCPGESFARDELFLFFTNLLQNFKIEFDPSDPIPPVKYVLGSSLSPIYHQIVFHKVTN